MTLAVMGYHFQVMMRNVLNQRDAEMLPGTVAEEKPEHDGSA